MIALGILGIISWILSIGVCFAIFKISELWIENDLYNLGCCDDGNNPATFIVLGSLAIAVAFLAGLFNLFVGINMLKEYTQNQPQSDVKIQCESIEGSYSEQSDSCYKNGVKIMFGSSDEE